MIKAMQWYALSSHAFLKSILGSWKGVIVSKFFWYLERMHQDIEYPYVLT
jgi:hypothetical protein